MKTTLQKSMLLSASSLAAMLTAAPAFAQDTAATAATADTSDTAIIVTGSRIARPNLTSASPIAVVTGEQTTANGDITLDTFLNTLPQVNPAGSTTSNNPGNNGQSNVNLRGLGSNRNLVLVDGRRPMVSATDQSVDLNTIPQGLIQRIEVVTGGAGATYGADAIAGVVNIILKNNFQGLDLRASYQLAVPQTDAREYQVSGVLGGNFADGRGNIAVAVDYSKRDPVIKSARSYTSQATSTTNTPPMGRYISSAANQPDQNVINAVFAKYGVGAAQAPTPSNILFNNDGTLIGRGVFNSPIDIANYRFDPKGNDKAAANQNFVPDFYSYNFDYVNLLVLPLERKSAFMTAHYDIVPQATFFAQGGYTEYNASTALAPTPVGTTIENSCGTGVTRAKSALVNCFGDTAATATRRQTITGLIVPLTNPFIPADLRTILNSRTGNDPALAGTGAAEGIRLSKRFLDTGLRRQDFRNQVLQGLVGLKGDITDKWRYEASYSWGRTIIDQAATGNVDVQKVQNLLESPTGGTNLCAGGFNPFGINPLSQACIDYVSVTGNTKTTFTQKVAQAFVSGDVVDLPAGPLAVVLGAEKRDFTYKFDPGALFGPISGFNTATPDHGTNSFFDIFGELQIPILKDTGFAKELTATLGYRRSRSDFNDIQNGVDGTPQTNDAYKAELTWAPIDALKFRASYQHSVRAPNFGELFSGGGSFPQYFDPCSANTNFIKSGGTNARNLCTATGVSTATYAQTPGSQAFIGISGNTGLKPEKGDTATAGFVFNQGPLIMSLDYYNIRIKDTIFTPDPNIIIAACYNYFGKNSTFNAASPYCSGLVRTPDISYISVPASLGGDANGYFQAINQGKIKTSGIDFQLGYRLPTDFAAEGSTLNANLLVNYLIDFKVEELPGLTLDYADTVSYFGEGLGTSFPKWKANLNLDWKLAPFTISTRLRYIDAMRNRASVQFPGETFTGTKSIIYTDLAGQVDVGAMSFRLGVNNLFDVKPPLYSPNVQSGTDPSLFDVIGRRMYVQAGLKF